MTDTNRCIQWWVLLFKVNMKFRRLYPSKHARYTLGQYVYKSFTINHLLFHNLFNRTNNYYKTVVLKLKPHKKMDSH